MAFNNWLNQEITTDTERTKRQYNRLAPFYDSLEASLEGLFFSQWREILWRQIEGQHILEAGVGTGKNFPLYPANTQITAIDFSEKMLAVAEKKKVRKNIKVDLALMDVQSLCYADNSFDTVIATFVFCSVPQPVKGLQELYRVCKPKGKVLFLEHVLSTNTIIARAMHLMNPLISSIFGANINRQTVKSIQSCGFQKVLLDPASGHIVKLIQAIK